MNICIFASGYGSNFENILQNINSGKIQGKIKLFITDKENCRANQIAKENKIESYTYFPKQFKNQDEHANALIDICHRAEIELICLSGYMSKLPNKFVNEFYGKIINMHPSLLPSFSGKGFYGEKVHKAVIENGVKISGVSIHFVNSEYDRGPIIAQIPINVYAKDSIETLCKKISEIEHYLYPEIISLFCEKRIILKENKVFILPPQKKKPETALLSLSNKEGLLKLAKALQALSIELISTGGTYEFLSQNGIKVTSVNSLSSFPEILDGRVKTLNNKIFGGILFKRKDPKHKEEITDNLIKPIDIVIVNLYPFEKVSQVEENWSEKLIENIDIGGVSLLRAAAKNYKDVLVVSDTDDYDKLISFLQNGTDDIDFRKKLAIKAFKHTMEYDRAIYEKLSDKKGKTLDLTLNKIMELRYGENPHQKAELYSLKERLPFEKLNGKELSYNNILDSYGSFTAVNDFQNPACAIFKHVTPCAMAIGEDICSAFEKAWSCDPLSAFGGIVALNTPCDAKIANFLSKKFIEIIIAPDFDKQALELLRKKTNLRILKWNEDIRKSRLIKSVGDEFLISDSDNIVFKDKIKAVSGELNEREEAALKFAFTCVKHIRSNAIVLTNETQTVGIGAGQMSRVDSVLMAAEKYRQYLKNNTKPEFLYLASDAFFPFEDAVIEAHKIGVKAIIQPGGSIRDKEVIEKAKELNIKMAFTNIRHFKH